MVCDSVSRTVEAFPRPELEEDAMTELHPPSRPAVRAALGTPTDLGAEASREIPAGLRALLADVFALYLKTKSFPWHMSGPHFRDYHLMLDEQADQIFAMTDPIAERARKLGGIALRSIGQIAREQRIADSHGLETAVRHPLMQREDRTSSEGPSAASSQTSV
jgi:DNA-binding ferritin-like protein